MGAPRLTALECMVQESRASAERKAMAKEERRRQMEEMQIEELETEVWIGEGQLSKVEN